MVISIIIITANRNIAFQEAMMSEAAFETRTDFVKSEMGEEASSVEE